MRVFVDYQGWPVRLTDERMLHILQHREMVELENEIPNVLAQPKFVKRSKTDASVQLYYRYCDNTEVGSKWLCVVVKFLPEDAFVITAYLTDKPKQGEQIWPNL